MTIAMQPIYTQVIGATAGGIVFNNIPQSFTDLKVVVSTRTNAAGTIDGNIVRFNGDTGSNYSTTIIYGTGTAIYSYRNSSATYIDYIAVVGNTATANTFSNWEVYIPNYTSANFKAVNIDGAGENNSSTNDQQRQALIAGLWRSTAAITSLSVGGYSGNPMQHSTFTLYGITKG